MSPGQSVSKWESGASLPDLDRILKMSDLFCVSTDYLLRDEVEQISMPEGEGIPEPDGVRSVSLEEANAFMDLTRSKSTRLAAAVSLCVLSPVTLILLGGYAEPDGRGDDRKPGRRPGGCGAAGPGGHRGGDLYHHRDEAESVSVSGRGELYPSVRRQRRGGTEKTAG